MCDPDVCSGRPVIRGTCIAVDIIMGKLAGGMSYKDVMKEYDIARDTIPAVLEFSAQTLKDEEVRLTK